MITVNHRPVETIIFPDGTPLLRITRANTGEWTQVPLKAGVRENLIQPDTKPITITWLYDNDSEFLRVHYIVNHLREKGFSTIDLNMPYIPNARFDRVKNDDEVFTLKYFAKLINDLNLRSVTVLDPHSYVSEALINNLIIRTAKDYVWHAINEIPNHDNLMLYFPDEGAMKRYANIANEMHLPFAFGIKQRDWRTGDIIGIDVAGVTEDIRNMQVLMVDDICSKGGTFYHNARALKKLNVGDIYLYISHCENAILQGDLINSGLMKHIFTTDSIYREKHQLITVLEPYNK